MIITAEENSEGYSISRRLITEYADCGIFPARLMESTESAATVSTEWRQEILLSLLRVLVMRFMVLYEEPSQDSSGKFQERVVEAIKQHIQQSAGRDDTLESLALMAGYSKYHFLRIFRHYVGMSVHDYINRCRRLRVEEMKAEGATMTEMSDALGFSCLSAFSRWYKTAFAITR